MGGGSGGGRTLKEQKGRGWTDGVSEYTGE